MAEINSGPKRARDTQRRFLTHTMEAKIPTLQGLYWQSLGVAIFFSRGSSRPKDRTRVSCIAGRRSTLWATREAWKSLSRIWLFATQRTIQSMEFSRPEYWSGRHFPSPGDLPNPGIEPRSPSLQADSLPSEPPGKPWQGLCFSIWPSFLELKSSLSYLPSEQFLIIKFLIPVLFPDLKWKRHSSLLAFLPKSGTSDLVSVPPTPTPTAKPYTLP